MEFNRTKEQALRPFFAIEHSSWCKPQAIVPVDLFKSSPNVKINLRAINLNIFSAVYLSSKEHRNVNITLNYKIVMKKC